MQTKRYEAFSGYGSYNQAHVFDNLKMWIVEFSPSFEAAQAKANELNSDVEREAERAKMDNSVLAGSSQTSQKIRGISI